ncbi:hypothetical protein Trydic_g10587, partial [Trypoxylus dichotomus]
DGPSEDNKQQQKTFSSNIVQGFYSVIDMDVTRRIVQYTVNPVNGLNAVVGIEPLVVGSSVVI